MTFVTAGLAIAGLAAVAVPILIHLLSRRRRKPIEWAAMRFLLEAFRKHRKRLQLEQILLLALRCLILALLGLALARPLLEGSEILGTGGQRTVYLLIDNGVASTLTGPDGRTALKRHIEQAVEVVGSLDPGDAVGLITAARPVEALVSPPSTDRGAIIDLLEAVEAGDSPTDLAATLRTLRSSLETREDAPGPVVAYLFSEFRRGSAPLDIPLADLLSDFAERVTFLSAPPAETAAPNTQVVSITPMRSIILPGVTDGSGQITVRLARHGTELQPDVTRVQLLIDDSAPLDPRDVKWEAGESEKTIDFIVDFTSRARDEISITAAIDADALRADDRRYLVLEHRDRLRVVMLDRRSFNATINLDRLSSGQWIRRALQPYDERGPMEIIEVEPAAVDERDLRLADVAVLPRPELLADSGWTILRQFVDTGGLLLIAPPSEANVHTWTDRLSRDLGLSWRIALEPVEFDDPLSLAGEQPSSPLLRLLANELEILARPVQVRRLLPVDAEQTQAESVLVLSDGSPLLIAGSPVDSADADGEDEGREDHPPQSRGIVVYLATAPDLDWTNLPSQPLMVPLVQEVVRQGVSLIRGSQVILAGEQPAIVEPRTATELVEPSGARIALERNGRPQHALSRAGLYTALDAADQPLNSLAVNIDAMSARTDVQSSSAVSAWLADAGPWRPFDTGDPAAPLRSVESGSPIAGLLLFIILFLVVLESLCARWFSHAYRTAGPEPVRHGRPAVASAIGGEVR